MANAVIGALRVVLGADTVAFDKGLKGTKKPLANLQSQFKKVAAAGTAMGAALSLAIRSGLQNLTDMTDAARTAGLAVENFSALKFAAEQSRVGVDALTDGIKELQLRADEFITTGKGSASEAFERLGFDAEDLSRRLNDPVALFDEIISRLRVLPTAAQIRISDEIFGGTGGEQFVRLLADGSKSLSELTAEARSLGVVVSGSTAAATDRLAQSMGRVSAVLSATTMRMAADAAPALERLANGFVAAMQEGTAFRRVIDGITANLDLIIGAIGGTVVALGTRLVGALVAVRAAAIAATFSLKGLRAALLTSGFGVAVAALGALAGALFASELGFDNNTRAIGDEMRALDANVGALREGQQMSANVARQKIAEIKTRRENIQAINDENRALLSQAEIELTNARRALDLAKQGARPGAAGPVEMLGGNRDEQLVGRQQQRIQQQEANITRLRAAMDQGGASASQASQAIAGLGRAIRNAADGTVTLGDEFRTLPETTQRITREFGGIGSGAGGAALNLDQFRKSTEDAGAAGSTLASTLSSQFSNVFQGLINGTMNAKQAIGQLLQSLGQLLINEAFSAIFGGIGGGAGGGIGGIISAIFGRRANGGPVASGKPYLVGERGPEIVVPNTSGTVISNRDMQAGGANDNITVTVFVEPSGEFDARVAGTSQRVAVNVVNANNKRVPGIVANAQKRSG